MESSIFADADCLRMTNNVGCGPLPIPQRRDDEIREIILRWAGLDESTRRIAGESIEDDQRYTLLAYSERMASLAVRKRSSELIYLGLLALGIDGWRDDWRDNAVLLALHHDAAKKIGIDPDIVFGSAGDLLARKVSESLQSFLRRSGEDQSLEAMGYEEGRDDGGFRYVRTW